MGREIEHKYLLKDESYKLLSHSNCHIIQGYLSRDPSATVRVRIIDSVGYLTVKGATIGDSRPEFEYKIPEGDALEMLKLCKGRILDKIRWLVNYEGFLWEIDEYLNCDAPTVAEIELAESTHQYPIPDFIGEEVTGDPRYYNSNII